MRLKLWAVVLFAAPTLCGAQAVEVSRARPPRVLSDKSAYTIVYDHVAGTVRVLDGSGRTRAAEHPVEGVEAALLPIPPDRPVAVRIEHANPLLYDYKVDVSITQKRQVRTCRNILGSFVEQGMRLSIANLSDVPQPRISVDSLLRGPLTEGLAVKAVGGTTRGSLDARRALADARVQIDRFVARADQLNDFARALNDSLAAVAEMGDATDTGTLLDDLRQHVLAKLPGVRRPADVGMQYRQMREELVPTATVVMEFASGPNATEVPDSRAEAQALRSRLDTALVSARQSYRLIQNHLARIDSARSQVTQQWLIPESGDVRRIGIRLEPTRGFADVPRVKTGIVESYTVPHTAFGCHISVGVAMLDQPAGYALHGDTIVSSASSDQRSTAQILFHFDLANTSIPIGMIAGIGLGANHRPDWYLGGSFALSDVVRVNAGAVWQKQQQLPDGYRTDMLVRDAATRAAITSPTRAYHAGFFWGVSLAR